MRSISRSELDCHGRTYGMLWVFSCLFVLAGVRLCLLTSKNTWLPDHSMPHTPPALASFFDRHGVLIAGSLQTYSIYANPQKTPHKAEVVKKMTACFPDLDGNQLTKRLLSNKGFVWIKRHITPAQKAAFLKMGLPGLFLQKDVKRIYPQKNLFSHIVGITDIDGRGLSGLEKTFSMHGQDVYTSLDSRVQYAMKAGLAQAIQHFQAEAGNAILLDIKNGEILGMVSLPDFDPNKPQQATPQQFFNRNTMGVYEFGSVFKIHNVAMALEHKATYLHTLYDASTPLRMGRFAIRDFRGKGGKLTLQEAFLRSSNIANAKIALHAGIQQQKRFFEKMSFFQRLPLELPEVAHPMVPAVWRESTLATASYGYGISITPLHLVKSVASIVSGFHCVPTLRKVGTPIARPRVIKPRTVQFMRTALRESVHQGHAKKTHIQGYALGAKTGTANLLSATGQYRKGENLVSCVGAFPIHNPRYVLLVTLEHPKPSAETYGYTTAGWTAAPAFKNIFLSLTTILGFSPHA